MKHCVIIILLAAMFASCKKESAPATLAPTGVLNDKIDTVNSTLVSTSGNFIGGSAAETASGSAKIYMSNGKYQLLLTNFQSTNGPALKVYLSKEIQPVHFVSLGSLKSTMGDQVYDIPVAANVTDYQYVLIYCEQYKSIYGYAKYPK